MPTKTKADIKAEAALFKYERQIHLRRRLGDCTYPGLTPERIEELLDAAHIVRQLNAENAFRAERRAARRDLARARAALAS